jgi:hypothetical protein
VIFVCLYVFRIVDAKKFHHDQKANAKPSGYAILEPKWNNVCISICSTVCRFPTDYEIPITKQPHQQYQTINSPSTFCIEQTAFKIWPDPINTASPSGGLSPFMNTLCGNSLEDRNTLPSPVPFPLPLPNAQLCYLLPENGAHRKLNTNSQTPLIILPRPEKMQAIGRNGASGCQQRHLGPPVNLQGQRQRAGEMFSNQREIPP